jgi:signal transduction histidine kinase
MFAQQLRAFYDADACLLITTRPYGLEYQLRLAERKSRDSAVQTAVLPMVLGHLLLAYPGQEAVIFSRRHWFWQHCLPRARTDTIVFSRGMWHASKGRHGQVVAAMLEATAFITMALPPPNRRGGRFYLRLGRRGAFDPTEVEFLCLVLDHLKPVLHHITPSDQVTSDAAEAERRRSALDVHDGVIQPYIGLPMGLEVVRHILQMGSTDVTDDIDCLLHLIQGELAQLRHLVHDLKCGGEAFDGLVPDIRRFSVKFTASPGIQVQVEVNDELSLDDRLAAEVSHIVA